MMRKHGAKEPEDDADKAATEEMFERAVRRALSSPPMKAASKPAKKGAPKRAKPRK